ncbi:chorismate mutase [Listeria weihenstephanensis FSL R9-0317]|uniref:chorismate mutase n=1 Tax=Listeria weihenstephanensis TaxID=1006155 RepID=A0A1S7FTX5_9LIST|nr:chorismate mutase [Listeria weihenstephanensis]AQY50785.1 chorismate mutase [Listeria weihenstephanensis]EUJ38414.1 chorismate mutase [Listeria weihenstephanensis FSL R9-0317]
MIRGIRGATTVTENTAEAIYAATVTLFQAIVKDNHLEPEAISSVMTSVTQDIDAAFPAKPIRELAGFQFVPIMGVMEIPVAGALPMCIRLMVNAELGDTKQQDVVHVYLEGAKVLRPDLAK